jgi:hypothetical protein
MREAEFSKDGAELLNEIDRQIAIAVNNAFNHQKARARRVFKCYSNSATPFRFEKHSFELLPNF